MLCLLLNQARAQRPETPDSLLVLRTSKIDDALHIDSLTGIYVDTSGIVPSSRLTDLTYDTALIRRFNKGIPTRLVSLPFYCRFTLKNDQDTTRSFYFFPGF
ncbi:MAG TPA: hypothetical protein VK859_08950, partial [bacterium]|nr:hypothetical protein [bacterium]